jgi:hypothetical protein
VGVGVGMGVGADLSEDCTQIAGSELNRTNLQ